MKVDLPGGFLSVAANFFGRPCSVCSTSKSVAASSCL